jgi:RNA polymerase sigma factor (sigma-70 family)
MTTQRYLPQRVFDGQTMFQNTAVVVEDGKIVGLETPNGEETVLSGLMAPGYIDVQVNGGGGALFNSTPTEAALSEMIATHSRYGTSGMLPTLITDSIDVMNKAANAISRVVADKVPGILGVHFEGPHLSVAKKGVHSTSHIRPLSEQEKQVFARDDLGVKIVTLAPENVSPQDIEYLTQVGCKVCLGHTNATFEQTKAALAAGATGFTHLYNATSSQLFAVSLKMLGRRELAEEALQEAYVKIWHNAAEYQHGKGAVLTWMISIVRYRALDMLRYQKVRKEDQISEEYELPAPDLLIDNGPEVNKSKLDNCMGELGAQQKQAIHLAYYNGLSHHEVVGYLDIPLGSIKSLIRRGLQKLHRCLAL